jgi:hypothetical protein
LFFFVIKLATALVVQFGLNSIGEHYVSNSWAAAIVMICFSVASALDATVQAQFFADVSLTRAGTEASRIRPRVLRLVYIQQSLSVVMWTSCCLGIAIAPTGEMQLRSWFFVIVRSPPYPVPYFASCVVTTDFFYALQVGVILLVVSPAIVHNKFMGDALVGMEKHIQELERRKQSVEVIKKIYEKVLFRVLIPTGALNRSPFRSR